MRSGCNPLTSATAAALALLLHRSPRSGVNLLVRCKAVYLLFMALRVEAHEAKGHKIRGISRLPCLRFHPVKIACKTVSAANDCPAPFLRRSRCRAPTRIDRARVIGSANCKPVTRQANDEPDTNQPHPAVSARLTQRVISSSLALSFSLLPLAHYPPNAQSRPNSAPGTILNVSRLCQGRTRS